MISATVLMLENQAQGGLASIKQRGIRRRYAGGVGQRAETRIPRIGPKGTAVGGEEVRASGWRILSPAKARSKALRVMTGVVRCPYRATERGKREIANERRLV